MGAKSVSYIPLKVENLFNRKGGAEMTIEISNWIEWSN